MRLQSARKFLAATGFATAGLIGAFTAVPAAQDKPLLAEQVFKNVQVLRGIPVDDFLDDGDHGGCPAVRLLRLSRRGRHRQGGLGGGYAEKQMARAMVTMVATINKNNFGGASS